MSDTSRNILIACGVLLLVACACISLIVIGGLSFFITDRGTVGGEILTAVSTVVIETVPEITATSPEGAEVTPTQTQGKVDEETAREMDEIQDQVIEIRALPALHSVQRSLLTPEQLRETVISDFLKDYTREDASDDAVVLSAFNLLDPEFDLYDFFIDLYSEQVAGYYDDETEQMYVVKGGGFEGPERLTYAHEYNHVLQDQNFDIEQGLNYTEELCEFESERCAAIQALLEGDSTLVEVLWFSQYATLEDQREIFDYYDQYNSPVYDNAPDFMKEDFVFPYQAGQEFVQSLYENGGWGAVNDAYEELPLSTEQILHPERYPDDKPVNVDLPELLEVLGDDWRELDRGVMGEWYTYLILALGLDENARLSEDNAKVAADGWGGDAYVVYYDDVNGRAMVLKTIWDTSRDAQEFKDQFETYAGYRFGDPVVSQADQLAWDDESGYTEFYIDGDETIWIFAPDSDTAGFIWDTVSVP